MVLKQSRRSKHITSALTLCRVLARAIVSVREISKGYSKPQSESTNMKPQYYECYGT